MITSATSSIFKPEPRNASRDGKTQASPAAVDSRACVRPSVRYAGFKCKAEMSDTGFTVPSMAEPPSRYDVTVTVARDDGSLPDPAVFAVAAEQAASARSASIMSAHTVEQIISIVTVPAVDRSSAVAIALAVVSEALRRSAAYANR